jgi:competence CoiA-like predicted nuclease
MEFGFDIITGSRLAPKKGLQAICPTCEGQLIAKCGSIKMHHWAHKGSPCTDTWKENETQWHRWWKSIFPEEWREILRIDNEKGERHRADIYNPNKDLYIEFQYSPISVEELQSRENFYKKMIWVVNGHNLSFSLHKIDILFDHIESAKHFYNKRRINDLYYFNHAQVTELRILQIKLINNTNLLNYKSCIKELVDTFYSIQDASIASHSPYINYDFIIKSSVLFQELIEPLFEKALESVNNILKEKINLFKYTLSSKIWKYAKMPIFVHYNQYLYLLKSGYICKLVTIQEFHKKYSSLEEQE